MPNPFNLLDRLLKKDLPDQDAAFLIEVLLKFNLINLILPLIIYHKLGSRALIKQIA